MHREKIGAVHDIVPMPPELDYGRSFSPGASALSSPAVKDAQSLADQLDEDPDHAEISKELARFTLYAEGKSFYKTVTAGRERYILVFSPALFVTRRQDREARIAKAEAVTAEINRDAMSAKGNRGAEPILHKAEKILSQPALSDVPEAKLSAEQEAIEAYRKKSEIKGSICPCRDNVALTRYKGLLLLSIDT